MYVTLQTFFSYQYNWWEQKINGHFTEVSDIWDITDKFLTDFITTILFWDEDFKKFLERNSYQLLIDIEKSNNNYFFKFDILVNSKKLWFWKIIITEWKNIWRY